MINLPFGRGRLFRAVQGKALPEWAADIGCTSWAQLLLKFVISHPVITCAIPATGSVEHLRQNMAAGNDPLPTDAQRREIAKLVASG